MVRHESGTGDDGARPELNDWDTVQFPIYDDDLREDLIDFAREAFREIYSGFSMDGSTIVVHRIATPGLPLDSAIKARFPNQALRFADSPRNEVELSDLTDRIAGDRAYWRSHGVGIVSYGPNPERGVVEVSIQQPARLKKEEFAERYGDGVALTGGARRGMLLPPLDTNPD